MHRGSTTYLPEVCGGRLLTGRLVAVAGECGVKIRLGGGGTHGVHTYYYIIIIIIYLGALQGAYICT